MDAEENHDFASPLVAQNWNSIALTNTSSRGGTEVLDVPKTIPEPYGVGQHTRPDQVLKARIYEPQEANLENQLRIESFPLTDFAFRI